MKKRLFLSGASGCGKSTMLRTALGGRLSAAGGFVTVRVCGADGIPTGFELRPAAAAEDAGQRFIDLAAKPPLRDDEVFRGTAPRLLKQAEARPFAVLDEIGGYEIMIAEFNRALEDFLSSGTPCIGVLKAPSNAAELLRHLGLKDEYMLVASRLRDRLRADGDTLVLETTGRCDKTAGHMVRQWVKEYADG